jgi:hypothetical protein
MLAFILLLNIGPALGATYTFDEVIHSRSVTERLRETEGPAVEGERVLFGDVIIRSDSAEVAWVASAPDILVLGLNNEVGVDGPGTVGRVFGKTDRTSVLRLIEFGAQGLVVSDAGDINGRAGWRCPSVTPAHRICHDGEGKPSASRQELDRLLAVADRGKAYEDFEGFQFGGRFIDREHILPTQINKFGQVVFIDPLGQFPNAIFLATPVLVGMTAEVSLVGGAILEICLGALLLTSGVASLSGRAMNRPKSFILSMDRSSARRDT